MPICPCGTAIFFGKTLNGKTVPLDSAAQIFRDVTVPGDRDPTTIWVEPMVNVYAVHRCPHVSHYSRQKVKEEVGK